MNYYQEITLIDQAEITSYFVWSKLYTQLHLALVEKKDSQGNVPIGVSFPEYIYEKDEKDEKDEKGKITIQLGKKLRIFAQTQETLQDLNIKQWLARLTDYAHISSIRPVPENRIKSYVSFYRQQFKSNAERLARRQLKRHQNLDFEQLVSQYQAKAVHTDLPYIQIKSLTNQHPFKLFIAKKYMEKSDVFVFNPYGLNREATVPEF